MANTQKKPWQFTILITISLFILGLMALLIATIILPYLLPIFVASTVSALCVGILGIIGNKIYNFYYPSYSQASTNYSGNTKSTTYNQPRIHTLTKEQKEIAIKSHLQTEYANKRKERNITQPLEVCILGMGPAGLLAALRAYSEGASITIIDKRETYTRENVFRFTDKFYFQLIESIFLKKNELVYNYLNKFFVVNISFTPLLDELFTDEDSFRTISINKFEELLYKCLSILSEADKDKIKILRGYDIQKIDPHNGLVTIQNTTGDTIKIKSQNIVNATGPNGKMQDSKLIVNSLFAENDAMAFMPVTENAPYLAATLSLNDIINVRARDLRSQRVSGIPQAFNEGADEYASEDPDMIEIIQARRERLKTLNPRKTNTLFEQRVLARISNRDEYINDPTLSSHSKHEELDLDLHCALRGINKYIKILKEEFQWERENRLPLIRQLNSTTAFYIGMEISTFLLEQLNKDDIGEEEKTQLVLKWVALNMAQFYPEETISKLKIKQHQAFEFQVRKSNFTTKEYDSGVRVFNLGDSLITPHFLTGTGVSSAFQQITAWLEFLKNKEEDSYLQQISAVQQETIDKVKVGLGSMGI